MRDSFLSDQVENSYHDIGAAQDDGGFIESFGRHGRVL